MPSALCDSPDGDIDFKSIYNLDDKYSQEEALKSGIGLTKAMRQITVDQEEEIERIDKEMKRLREKRAYSKLAFWCFNQYIRLGTLETMVKGEVMTVG